MMKNEKIAIALALTTGAFSLSLCNEASAQDRVTETPTESASGLVAHGQAGGQVNPPAVLLSAGLAYRHVLSQNDATGRDEHYVQFGTSLAAHQSYVAPQLHLEWSPLPLFTLRGEYELLGFTGASRGMLSFADRHADFSESVVSNADAKSGLAHKAQISPILRPRFGPIVIQNKWDFAYYRYTGDGPVYYEIQHDSLVARGDVVINGRTEVKLEAWKSGRDATFQIGPGCETTRAIRTKVQRQRLFAALQFTPADQIGPMLRPTIFMDVGVNADDVNRQGEAFGAFGFRTEMQ